MTSLPITSFSREIALLKSEIQNLQRAIELNRLDAVTRNEFYEWRLNTTGVSLEHVKEDQLATKRDVSTLTVNDQGNITIDDVIF